MMWNVRAGCFSYAMKNAENKAKEAARFQAPANTEAGVLQVIEQYLKESREMAVQLLEQWLLKEQAKLQENYRKLNQVSGERARYHLYRGLHCGILSTP